MFLGGGRDDGVRVAPECHVRNQARYPVVLTQNEVLNEVPNHPIPVREGSWGREGEGRGGAGRGRINLI